MSELTHINAQGEASMVDVTHKPVLLREAIAEGCIYLQSETIDKIESKLQGIIIGNRNNNYFF